MLITGATQGIGRAIALELANEGASLVLNARDTEGLQAIVQNLQRHSSNVEILAGDIRDQHVVEQLVEIAIKRFARIDGLINNVGGGSDPQPFEEIDDSTWDNDIELNLKTSFRMCREVIPIMKQQRYGRIVNISSVAGRNHGTLSGPSYSAAKAGLQGLTRHLASELGQHGITVNALAPGLTDTARARSKWDRLTEQRRQQAISKVALRRFAAPEEIARAALFLCSDDASYVTGATLDVNGGSWMA